MDGITDEVLRAHLDVRAGVEQQRRAARHRQQDGDRGPVDPLQPLDVEQRGREHRTGGPRRDEAVGTTVGSATLSRVGVSVGAVVGSAALSGAEVGVGARPPQAARTSEPIARAPAPFINLRRERYTYSGVISDDLISTMSFPRFAGFP